MNIEYIEMSSRYSLIFGGWVIEIEGNGDYIVCQMWSCEAIDLG